MNADLSTARYLGAAVLFVFVASLISEQLLTSIVGTGNISDVLVNISKNISKIRISNLVALLNSVGIVVLASLLYIVFRDRFSVLAIIALGLWLAEGITLAISKIGANSLISISQEFVAAGMPESSYFQKLGDFFYNGFDRLGYEIHMLFFSLGGILWTYMFYSSGIIPQVLSLWGLIALCLLSVFVIISIFDRNIVNHFLILAIPYAPFELVLGLWLMIKGFN